MAVKREDIRATLANAGSTHVQISLISEAILQGTLPERITEERVRNDSITALRGACASDSLVCAPARRGCERSDRLLWDRHRRRGTLILEDQTSCVAIPIDTNHVAQVDLAGGQQVGERRDHLARNRPFQMPRAISQVRAFAQQEGLCL